MSVTFTANKGLAKPDDTEFAKEWARNAQLQDDNNQIIEANEGWAFTTYIVDFTAQTTTPSVGAGSINGQYQNIEGFVMGEFSVDFLDPGTSAGSGLYVCSLPFVADNTFHSVGTAFGDLPGTLSVIGEGYFRDNSATNTSGSLVLDVITIAGVSYARFLTETFTGKTSRFLTNAQPVTVATGDSFTGNFFYKKA